MEQWKPYPPDPRYLVSDQGRVRGPKGGILKPGYNNKGYPCIQLCKGQEFLKENEKRCKNGFIHRMVLITFVGFPPDGMQACHGPKGNGDASLENLRWDTKTANEHDKRRDGTLQEGERHGLHKLTNELVRYIRDHPELTLKELARYCGVHFSTVAYVRRGETWDHVD